MSDRRRGAGLTGALAVAVTLVAVACSLSGLTGGGTNDDGGPPEASADASPPPPLVDAAVDGAPSCASDLQSDPRHCGRCGHSCAGGACAAGKCEAVVLAAGLGNPSGIAVGPADIYITTSNTARVLRLSKSGGVATELAANQPKASGVALTPTTLYWANGDYAFNDAGSNGGVWQCALPSCTNKQLLVAGDFARNPVIRGATLYFAATNGDLVSSVPLAGGTPIALASLANPFSVAVDDAHVYVTSQANSVFRAALDGGELDNEKAIGKGGLEPGFIAVDDARVYWAFADLSGKGGVVSLKKDLSDTVAYGDENTNVFPSGVAVDAENIYWSTAGEITNLVPKGDGKVYTCKKTGCSGPPRVLATGLVNAGPLALDDAAVYWVEFGTVDQPNGRVRKVAKP